MVENVPAAVLQIAPGDPYAVAHQLRQDLLSHATEQGHQPEE